MHTLNWPQKLPGTKKPNSVVISVQIIQRITFCNVFAKFHDAPQKSSAFILEDLLAMNPPRVQPLGASYSGVSCALACGGQLECYKINGHQQL